MSNKSIPKNKLAFVVHEDKNVPKYFEINKSLLKFFLIILPIISLISLATVTCGILYFKSINDILKIQESSTVTKLREEKIALGQHISFLKNHNSELEKKLASTDKSSLDVLNLVKFTSGQVDKSRFSNIDIETSNQAKDFIPFFDSQQIHLKFNLKNKSPTNKRQSGFLFMVMKTENLIQIYPKKSFAEDDMQIVFNRGEIFGFNHSRPTHVTFDLQKNINKINFMLLLFNKLGDLIHKESFSYEKPGT